MDTKDQIIKSLENQVKLYQNLAKRQQELLNLYASCSTPALLWDVSAPQRKHLKSLKTKENKTMSQHLAKR